MRYHLDGEMKLALFSSKPSLEPRGGQYVTNVADWTRTYDRHHLCKHLVQAVQPPRAHFWRKVIRRRVKPIYQHQSLIAKGNDSPAITLSLDPGAILDGDDNIGAGQYRKPCPHSANIEVVDGHVETSAKRRLFANIQKMASLQ